MMSELVGRPVGARAHRALNPTMTGRLCAIVLVVWCAYLLVASTNGFGWIDSWHNEQRAGQLVLLTLTALCVLVVYVGSDVRRLPALHWSFWTVLAVGLISSLRAEFVWDGLGELALYTALAGLVFVSAIVVRSYSSAPRWIERGASFLALAFSVGILVRYGAALSIGKGITNDVLLLGFANPRFASAFYVLLFPFLAAHALRDGERGALRGVAFASLVLMCAFNLALGTRAVLAAIAAAGVAFGWFYWRRRSMNIVWTIAAAFAAGFLLYQFLFHLVPSWFLSSEGFAVRQDSILSPNGRQLLLQSSIDAIRSAPLLGIGPMQFAAIPHVWAAHPHNWLLQLAAEYGLPAAASALLAIAVGLWRLKRQVLPEKETDGTLFAPALLMTLLALAYGLVDGNLVMPVSQGAAAIGFGALLGSTAYGNRSRAEGNAANRYATALAIAGSAAVLVVYGQMSFAGQEESVKRFREVYAKDRFFVPRFWEQGLLISGAPSK